MELNNEYRVGNQVIFTNIHVLKTEIPYKGTYEIIQRGPTEQQHYE